MGWGDAHNIIDIVMKIQGNTDVGCLHLKTVLGKAKKEVMSEILQMKIRSA